VLFMQLCPKLPRMADITVNFRRERHNRLHMNVTFTKEAAEAAMGVVLAMCTGNREAMPPNWKNGVGRVTLQQFIRVDPGGPRPLTRRPTSAMQCAYKGVVNCWPSVRHRPCSCPLCLFGGAVSGSLLGQFTALGNECSVWEK
jgi:hypothetical protein